jgi:catechol 2,3-dioxygenase-like lactoylglutathione lyase family enzyme
VLSGVNHITLLTSDLDRLAIFYEEVFGTMRVIELPIPEPEGPGRHALIAIGACATLHVFEFARIKTPTARPMFERGRIDHFALGAADSETFERLRADLVARGCSDGVVTDFGVMRVLTFTDPDGHAVELAHWVGGVDPTDLDMSRATDDERTVQRAASAPIPRLDGVVRASCEGITRRAGAELICRHKDRDEHGRCRSDLIRR